MTAMRGARETERRTRVRLSRAGLALTFVIAAAAGAGGGLTLASFSNTTQNPANSFQADTLAAPTNLSASGGTTVQLTWTPSSSTWATGYRIFRSGTSGGPYTQINQVAGAGTSSSTDTPGSGTFYYTVAAYRGTTWESPKSNEAVRTDPTFVFKSTTAQTGTNCASAQKKRDMQQGFVPTGPQQTHARVSTGTVNFCSETFSAGETLQAGTTTVEAWLNNSAGSSCSITATLFHNTGTAVQLGSQAKTIPNQTPTTLYTWSFATSGATFSNGDRLTVYFTWQSVKACDSTFLRWNDPATPSRVTVAGFGSSAGTSATYPDEVMADSPVAYWRLGDTGVVLSDDFETFSGWSDLDAGTFTQSSEQARGGTKSGKKDTSNDTVGGGAKSLDTAVGNDWTLETWVYRPSSYSGGSADRVGLEDGSGNGYSFAVDHSGNQIRIDRRDAAVGTTLSTATLDPPENAWVRAVLSRSGSSLTFTLYNAAGTQLGTVSASDATHSTFEEIAVRGGYHYYLDDLSVRTTATAVDEVGTYNGTYLGGVTLGQTGALVGDSDKSISLDGNDDYAIRNPFNGMPASAISVEFWMKSSDTSKAGTPVSYATTANNNEFLVFDYRNFTIHTGGANVVTGVSANNGAWHHIVVTWRGSDGQTRLYKDGAQAWSGTLSSGSSIANGGAMVLGQEQDTVGGGFAPAQAFLGNLDEVAVYSTVLSATRVQAHYDAGT